MAQIQDFKPDFQTTMPGLTDKGYALLNSLTSSTIWAETDLQYYFGNAATVASDAEFASDFQSTFGNKTIDAEFYFETLTARAFAMIDTLSNLDFTEATDVTEADQVLISTNAPKAAIEGFFEFPGTSFHDASPFTDSWSLGAINSGIKVMTALPKLAGDGEYANWTLLHEIGHSLGLLHTHKESRGLPPLATVGKFMDNERYSVMSYNGATNANGYGHAVGYMALDIASLQALYGAETYADDGSTYMLMDAGGGALNLDEGNVQIGRAYYSIWDSGGEDQIDYIGSTRSVMINLNDATLDTAKPTGDLKALISQIKVTGFFKDLSSALQDEITDAWHHAGGFFSRVLATKHGDYRGIDGGYTIAHGAEIESANGGADGDFLIGNEGNNNLYGNGGNDTLLGGSGIDLLEGGEGKDRLDGGRGDDTLTGGMNADIFVFSTGYGTDEITDFEAGDRIDLSRMKEIVNLNDLKTNHATEQDGDVYITAGADVLIIKEHTIEDLTKADFLF